MAQDSNKYILRMYEEKDYGLFKQAWEAQNEAAPPPSALPMVGFAMEEGRFFGFLANTDCDFMICTWYVCKKDMAPKEKRKALEMYFNKCKEHAKDRGKKYLFVYTNYSGIVKLLESLNFISIQKGHLAFRVV